MASTPFDMEITLNVSSTTDAVIDVASAEVLAPNYPLMVMICILMVVILLGNSLSIKTLVSTPSLFNQTGYCLINLAIADLSIGFLYLPFCLPVTLTGEWYSNDILCRIMTSTAIVTVIVSITSLAIVSVDRYISISRPLHYQQLLSKRRMFILLLLCWGYASALATFSAAVPHFIKFQPFFYNCGIDVTGKNTRPYTITLLTLGFYVPLSTISFCSVRIARISWRARCAIKMQHVATGQAKISNVNIEVALRNMKEFKYIARIFIVIIVFLICWGPFAIEMHYGLITRGQFPWRVSVAFEFLAKFNSAMNPFIYMITNAKFRKAFIEQNCCCFLKRKRKIHASPVLLHVSGQNKTNSR